MEALLEEHGQDPEADHAGGSGKLVARVSQGYLGVAFCMGQGWFDVPEQDRQPSSNVFVWEFV